MNELNTIIMFIRKIFFLSFLLIMAIGMLSCVNANDLAGDLPANASVDEIGIDESIEDSNENNAEIIGLNLEEGVIGDSNQGTFTELQDKIDSASEWGTVTLDKDYYYDDGFRNTYHGIQIKKSITINGNGHIVDGLSKTNLFQAVDTNTIIINNVTFQNGYTSSQSVPCNGNVDYLKFYGCNFYNNKGGSFSGALTMVQIDTLSFVNCLFEGNRGEAGGAIYLQQVNDTSFEHCKFSSNLAVVGGAIYSCKSGDFSFDDCIFFNNWADKGGSLCLEVCDSLKVTSTNFTYGCAIGMGGNLYLHILPDCQFKSCNFDYNNASYGGVFYCDECNLNLFDSSFSNSLVYGYGGVIDSISSNITINKCRFTVFVSKTDAGAAIYNLRGNLNVINSSFNVGMSKKSGGAIANLKSNLTVQSSNFTNVFSSGGAIYTIYGSVDVRDAMFNGTYGIDGSAIFCEIPDSATFVDNVFLNSFSKSIGSTISVINPESEVIVIGNHYEDAYHFHMEYVGYLNGERFVVKSRVLNYVLSNDGTYLNKYQFEDSDGDYHEFVSLEFWDPNYPDNFTIYGDYNSVVGPKYNFTKAFYFDDEFRYAEYLNYYVYDDLGNLIVRGEKQGIERVLQLINTSSMSLDIKMYSDSVQPLNGILSKYPTSLISSSKSDLSIIPIAYDSRDYGYITPVKDQSHGGNCWAFAGIATLEACIKKATGITYDFSEENVKNLMATYSSMGLKMETNAGGYDSMLMAYLNSWTGPIPDNYEEYHDTSVLSGLYYTDFPIQNIVFLPARQSPTDNVVFKRAIMDYGAFAITIRYSDAGYHAVCVVGWDDTYKGLDSLGNPSNGAWIFKNSWGTDWGNEGFGYLSYDSMFTSDRYNFVYAYTFTFNENDDYVTNYQLERGGVSDYLYSEGDIYCKNIFESKGSLEYLTAFATYFKYPTKYVVSVYKNDKLVHSQSGYSEAGYYTIPFNKKILLGEYEKFSIVVKNCNNGENVFPICLSNELNNVNFEKGTSFVSFDGVNWLDLYNLPRQEYLYKSSMTDTCQVACIKAFTSLYDGLYEMELEVNKFDNIDLDKKINIELSLYDLGIYNFDTIEKVKDSLITVNIDGKNYYAVVDEEGKASLNVSFSTGGVHKLTAQYKNNLFESNVIEFNFNVNKMNAVLSASSVTKIYGGSENSIVRLKDDKGNVLANEIIIFNLNGKSVQIKTNSKGQATMPINVAPKAYIATISYAGSGRYNGATTKVNIVVKKATPKISAAKKAFKLKVKSKKYTIILKDNFGKAIKNVQVTIKVKSKTYKAKTNAKGKATFKLKLTKKAKYKSTVKFSGNAYYNAASKKVQIIVKK